MRWPCPSANLPFARLWGMIASGEVVFALQANGVDKRAELRYAVKVG
jgi:hypothetical protein